MYFTFIILTYFNQVTVLSKLKHNTSFMPPQIMRSFLDFCKVHVTFVFWADAK